MAVTDKARATASTISAVAAQLFREQGFDGTTVSDVAAGAGVATGTVLLHFGSKSALATAAFTEQIAEEVRIAAATLPGTSIADDLAHVVRQLYTWYESNEVVATALLRESLFSDGPWSARYAGAVAKTIELFSAIDRRHAGTAAGTIESTLAGERLLADYLLVLLRARRGQYESVEDQVRHFLDLAGA